MAYKELDPSVEYGASSSLGRPERFPTASAYKDTLWAFFFIAHFIVMVVLAVGTFQAHEKEAGEATNAISSQLEHLWSSPQGQHVVTMSVSGIFIAGLWSFTWLLIMREFAGQLIWFTLCLGIAFSFAMAFWCLLQGITRMSLIFLVVGLFNLWWLYVVRSRIAFSKLVLEVVSDVVKRFPGTMITSLLSMLPLCVWLLIWVLAVKRCFVLLPADNDGSNLHSLVIFLLLISFFWTLQVITNVVHVTVAGTVASWYFYQPNVPANSTWNALKRACSTSFGSICLGSLLVAIIKAMRAMAEMGRRSDNSIARACCVCFLGCLENLMEWFNLYAYTQVAIYGKDFTTAAKHTWQLIKHSGVEALIQQDLIGGVLSLGIFIGGILNGLVVGWWAKSWLGGEYCIQNPAPDLHECIVPWWSVVGVLAAFFGWGMMLLTTSVVESAVATVYVCYAEEPMVLRDVNPGLYSRFVESTNGAMGGDYGQNYAQGGGYAAPQAYQQA